MTTAIILTAAFVLFSPWTFPFTFRLLAKAVGSILSARTAGRKAQLQSLTREHSSRNASQQVIDDPEWETVEKHFVGTAPNGGKEDDGWSGVVGFFHPFCNAGGGGERVLWAAIRATQDRWPNATCVVYTGDHDVDKASIIKRVQDRFNISLNPHTLDFLYLTTRHYVLASTWPRFTLLGQSLGSLLLAFDAFGLLVPDIYIDTMGFAFTIALCKLLFPHVPTAAYVHYPTISTDMLSSLDDDVSAEGADPNQTVRGLNAGAGSGLRGDFKRRYWQLFAKAYTLAGNSVDIVMTNSSWTKSHIQQLWGPSRISRRADLRDISVVFPPVAVADLESRIKVTAEFEKTREPILLYIAQFRPEKNHPLILSAFAEMIRGGQEDIEKSRPWDNPSKKNKRPKLVLVGGVRDDEDRKRVYKLRLHTNELQIKDDVEFVCDASWPEVLRWLARSSVGVNGMWNEHFGIGVVEYQASGLIAVVNNSGGPKEDIVIPGTGFHASSVTEYAEAFEKALTLKEDETLAMRRKAQESARRFGEEVFAEQWIKHMEVLVGLQVGDHGVPLKV